MTIKEYIDHCKELGIEVSYSSIARDVPCHFTYIAKIANNEKTPSYKMARRIEQITDGKVKRTNWYPEDDI